MGEILGLGMTHYPPLTGLDQNMAGILRRVLQDPGLPERYRDPGNWPEAMRREYGDEFEKYPQVNHIHFFGAYISNYPDLETDRIKALCELLNSI